MAVIRQLKNFFTNQIIYPKTLTKAVYDEGGERLDKILRDTMLATDNEEYSGVEPRDSDTLGGKYKSTDINTLLSRIEELEEENEKLNSNLTNIGSVEIGYNTEVTIGNNLYKKSIIYDGSPNGSWKTVSNIPSDAKNIRIDYGLSYILFDGYLYPINSTAMVSDVRISTGGDLQFYIQGTATVHAVIFIIYNK